MASDPLLLSPEELASFPTDLTAHGVDVAGVVRIIQYEGPEYLRRQGIKGMKAFRPGDSVGVFVSNPKFAGKYSEVAHDPRLLTGCLIVHGPNGLTLAYDAMRAARAVAREGLNLHQITVLRNPVGSAVARPGTDTDVDTEPDWQWGDLDLSDYDDDPDAVGAGCVILGEGPSQIIIGVAGYTSEQCFGAAAYYAGILVPMLGVAIAAAPSRVGEQA